MTHQELCMVAERWLRRTKHCTVVSTSACIMTDEQPDCIGWKGQGFSWVIECKVSRVDFLRDQKKWHRLTAGMGDWRYYLTPPALLKANEIPDGWGLLELHGRSVKVIVPVNEAIGREKAYRQELRKLISMHKRLAEKGSCEPSGRVVEDSPMEQSDGECA